MLWGFWLQARVLQGRKDGSWSPASKHLQLAHCVCQPRVQGRVHCRQTNSSPCARTRVPCAFHGSPHRPQAHGGLRGGLGPCRAGSTACLPALDISSLPGKEWLHALELEARGKQAD